MKEEKQRIPIEQVSEEEDLGVTFCGSLKIEKHSLNCVNRANKILGNIKRCFTYIDIDMLLPLYESHIRPHLECAVHAGKKTYFSLTIFRGVLINLFQH